MALDVEFEKFYNVFYRTVPTEEEMKQITQQVSVQIQEMQKEMSVRMQEMQQKLAAISQFNTAEEIKLLH